MLFSVFDFGPLFQTYAILILTLTLTRIANLRNSGPVSAVFVCFILCVYIVYSVCAAYVWGVINDYHFHWICTPHFVVNFTYGLI